MVGKTTNNVSNGNQDVTETKKEGIYGRKENVVLGIGAVRITVPCRRTLGVYLELERMENLSGQ